MSAPSTTDNKPKVEEEDPKTFEDLVKEIKKLKEIIAVYKNDITMLKVDKQAKDWKMGFFDQRVRLQDEQISDLKTSMKEIKKNHEEVKQFLQREESENKRLHEKRREELIKYKNIKYEETPIIEDEKIKFEFKKDITTNAPTYCSATQMFSTFKTVKGETMAAYVTKDRTIELYDLEKETPIKTIKDAHSKDIHSCRHFLDTKTNSDLLITSSYDKSVKVWNVEKMDRPLLTIENAHSNGYIFTSCILSHEKLKENFIITGADDEGVKFFDFKGKFLDKKVNMHDYINLLDFYYEKNENKYYVIIANSHDIRAYEFYDLSNYKTFIEREASSHAHVVVRESENKVHLIDSDMKGFIHIWDFNTEECLKTIFVQTIINGICLWDDQHVICTGRDQKIKVVDLKEGRIVRVLTGHDKETLSVQKINLSKYGDCLVSHGKDGILKVWAFLKSQ